VQSSEKEETDKGGGEVITTHVNYNGKARNVVVRNTKMLSISSPGTKIWREGGVAREGFDGNKLSTGRWRLRLWTLTRALRLYKFRKKGGEDNQEKGKGVQSRGLYTIRIQESD